MPMSWQVVVVRCSLLVALSQLDSTGSLNSHFLRVSLPKNCVWRHLQLLCSALGVRILELDGRRVRQSVALMQRFARSYCESWAFCRWRSSSEVTFRLGTMM